MYTKLAKILLLVLCLNILLAPVVAARSPEEIKQIERQEKTTPPLKDEGSMFENVLGDIIDAIRTPFDLLLKMGGFKTLNELIFNTGGGTSTVPAPFDDDEWHKALTWYHNIAYAMLFLLVLGIAYTSIRMMGAGLYNPVEKIKVSQDIGRWIVALLMAAALPYIFTALSEINGALVKLIVSIAGHVDSTTGGISQMEALSPDGDLLNNLTTGSVIGTAVAKLAIIGVQAYLNILYIIRKIMLLAIFIFGGIGIYMWAVSGQGQPITVVFGELLSNMFLQTAHALVFGIMLTFVSMESTSWIEVIVWLILSLSIAEVFRNVFQSLLARYSGVNESGKAQTIMRMAGMGAIGAIGQTFGGPKGGGGFVSGGFGGSSGGGGSGTPGGPEGIGINAASFKGTKASSAILSSVQNASAGTGRGWGLASSALSKAGVAAGNIMMGAVPGGENMGESFGRKLGRTGSYVQPAAAGVGRAIGAVQGLKSAYNQVSIQHGASMNSGNPLVTAGKKLAMATGALDPTKDKTAILSGERRYTETAKGVTRAANIISTAARNPGAMQDLMTRYDSTTQAYNDPKSNERLHDTIREKDRFRKGFKI